MVLEFRRDLPTSRAVQLLAVALLAVALSAAGGTSEAKSAAKLAPGAGSFAFPFVSANEKCEITVWYYRPAHAGPDAKIVFVLHGEARNSRTYRKHWIPIAERKGFILLVPEFSKLEFPGSRSYNLGNVSDRNGLRYPEGQRSYTAIEDIFDAVRKDNTLSAPSYDLYGHSAGAQLVHRLVLL